MYDRLSLNASLFSLIFQMLASDARPNAKKTQWVDKIVLWSGVNAIIHSIIAVCHCG